jgi:hypothetical protein
VNHDRVDTKLDKLLPDFYRQMHQAHAFLGDSWLRHKGRLLDFVPAPPAQGPILDFGCGPEGGLAADCRRAWPWIAESFIPHDPYVPAYAQDPWKSGFRVFFSCDVFEHLPAWQLSHLLLRLRKHASCDKIFVALSTRPANKCLPNGLNAHLTVRPVDWWHGFFSAALGGVYTWAIAEADLAAGEAVFALVKDHRHAYPGPVLPPPGSDDLHPGDGSVPAGDPA